VQPNAGRINLTCDVRFMRWKSASESGFASESRLVAA
jgi:hypothetical protein